MTAEGCPAWTYHCDVRRIGDETTHNWLGAHAFGNSLEICHLSMSMPPQYEQIHGRHGHVEKPYQW